VNPSRQPGQCPMVSTTCPWGRLRAVDPVDGHVQCDQGGAQLRAFSTGDCRVVGMWRGDQIIDGLLPPSSGGQDVDCSDSSASLSTLIETDSRATPPMSTCLPTDGQAAITKTSLGGVAES
jgi:hypothetical protein